MLDYSNIIVKLFIHKTNPHTRGFSDAGIHFKTNTVYRQLAANTLKTSPADPVATRTRHDTETLRSGPGLSPFTKLRRSAI